MKVLHYGAVYLSWLINLLLDMWIIFLCRNIWLTAFNSYFIQDSLNRQYMANLLDKVFFLILGFIWLILMIVYEPFFRKGIEKKEILKRFTRVTGPTLLVTFVLDGILALMTGLAIIGWLRGGIILFDLVVGVLLVWIGWKKL